MSAVMTQISALGRADVDTVIRPSLTFWKSEYKKHTNFAMEAKRAEAQGVVGYGRRNTFKIPRQGDLIAKMYWYVKTDPINSGLGGAHLVEDFGRAIQDETTFEVGSVVYGRLYAEAMHLWEEFTTLKEQQLGKLTGKSMSEAQLVDWGKFRQHFYIPLPFWFSDNDYGSAWPMIAAHMTEVQVNINTKTKAQCIKGFPGPYVIQAADAEFSDSYLLLETVYLDDAERQFLVENELKYVITQYQTLGLTTLAAGLTSAKVDLHFNQPCKLVMFAGRTDTNTAALNWFNFQGQETGEFVDELFSNATITLNNNNRFDPQTPFYLRQLQAAQHMTRIPDKHAYIYNFSLYPEDANPSGTINFSRIDSSRLVLNFGAALPVATTLYVFTKSINVVSILRGVAQLRFA